MKRVDRCRISSWRFFFLVPAPKRRRPTTTPAADPLICKRFDETGSLARKRKVCKTKSEWSKSTSELQDSMNRFVEERRGRPPTGN
jgi:hypothetical protein